MRLSRFTTGMAIVFFAAVDIATTSHEAEPFHAGAVGPGDGCHTMHNSADAPAAGSGTSHWLLQGTDPSSICLNCHRAHASAFRAIGRWDFDASRLADSHPAFGDGGVSGKDVLYSYCGRYIVAEFGSAQRASATMSKALEVLEVMRRA